MTHATIDHTSSARGSASLEVTVAASPNRVFDALVDPAHAREWFGVLSSPLVEGGTARLDFEDGDFFAIDDVHLERPSLVTYHWRFLGLAPQDAIEWHIEPDGEGTRVTVVDTDPMRAPEWNDALREGWRDFTSRLVRYVETGQNARYAWRAELDGGVEIPASATAALRLLKPDVLPAWLPSGGLSLESGTSWTLHDGLEPARVDIDRVKHGASVRFTIEHPQWKAATEVSLSVRARGPGAMLSFSHNGWEHIAGDHEYQKRQRRRFAALWIDALARARDHGIPADAGA